MKDATANNTAQSVTDDQDLAKVLAGNMPGTADSGLQFEAAPLPGSVPQPIAPAAPAPLADATTDQPAVDNTDLSAALDEAVHSLPEPAAAQHSPQPTGSSELDDIKKEALEQLRPLVDKLDLKADEKFDTLLLIIRSTDDKSLLGPAHQAAKAIEDDARRAQALLDVIKEIDYFSNQAA